MPKSDPEVQAITGKQAAKIPAAPVLKKQTAKRMQTKRKRRKYLLSLRFGK